MNHLIGIMFNPRAEWVKIREGVGLFVLATRDPSQVQVEASQLTLHRKLREYGIEREASCHKFVHDKRVASVVRFSADTECSLFRSR